MVHKKLYIIQVLIFVFSVHFSQEISRDIYECLKENDEIVYVHLANEVYFPGEIIQYKAYVFNTSTFKPGSSIILYFQLLNENDSLIISWKCNVINKQVISTIKVPAYLNTGFYKLYAFTNWMRNYPANYYFSVPIFIIKPYETEFNTFYAEKKQINNETYNRQNSNQKILITNLDSLYKKNENIQINLKVEGLKDKEEAYLSVSIKEKNPFFLLEKSDISTFLSRERDINSLKLQSVNLLYPKENNGFILAGSIVDSMGYPLSNVNVTLSIIDTIPGIKCAETNKFGKFYFLLNEEYENKELIIQQFDKLNANATMYIDIPNIPVSLNNKIEYNLLNSEKEYIEYCKKLYLIKSVYNPDTFYREDFQKLNTGHRKAFYGQPDFVVYPGEFESLNNFQEIAVNILPWLRVKKTGHSYSFSMLNRKTGLFMPDMEWIIIDGVCTNNLNYIASLGSYQIDRIEARLAEYMYGNLTFNGVLSIFTKERNIPAEVFKNAVIYKNEIIPNINYELNTVDYKDNVPDLRQVLYWNPDITINQNEEVEINFKTSLLKTRYIIEIQGLTNEGNLLNYINDFKVENE